jgi:hypothetical protein
LEPAPPSPDEPTENAGPEQGRDAAPTDAPAVAPALAPGAPPVPVPAAFATPSRPPLDPQRRRDRMLGLILVAASFAVCLGLSLWAKEKSRPETSLPPGPPTVAGIVGYPNAVDALATLGPARKLTPRPQLRGIVFDGVQSDGTIDVSEGPGRVRYTFQSEAGQGPQPPREPGTLPKRITCGKQNVVLRKEGLVAEPDQADYPCSPGGIEPLPEPQCTLKELWKLAKRRRVPRDRGAHIEYYRAKAGPAWRFEISGTAHRFVMYGDCKRELSGVETHGSVP